MELDVIPGFPTLIGRLLMPDAVAMNRDLQTLILAEEMKCSPTPDMKHPSLHDVGLQIPQVGPDKLTRGNHV